MKARASADALRIAVAAAKRFTAPKSGIPILGAVLLAADDDSLTIIGHKLESCCTARCPAIVESPGAAAVPAERLAGLLAATSKGVDIAIELTAKALAVRTGTRSVFRLPILPAQEFPPALAPKGATARFTVAPDVLAALLMPGAAIGDEAKGRPHLDGLFLHSADGKSPPTGTISYFELATLLASASFRSMASTTG
jgi:DNA polymerase III sliding clamp (beta) subunit (PCNA family)